MNDHPGKSHPWAGQRAKLALLTLLIVAFGVGAWWGGQHTRRAGFYFLYAMIFPILVAAFGYGRAGGLLVAWIASLIAGVQLLLIERPQDGLGQWLFLICNFNLIALLTGELLERGRKQHLLAQRRASELAALIAIDQEISSTLDLPYVLERIARHAQEIVGADDSDIYLLEPLFSPDAQTLRAVVSLSPYADEIMATPIKLGEGIVGAVAQQGEAENIPHAERDPRSLHIPDTPVEPESLLCAPLVAQGQVIGVMVLGREGEQTFSQADLNFLVSLAQQAAIAIQNAWLFEGARARAIEQARLNEITRIALATHDSDEMLGALTARVGRLLGADNIFVTRWDPSRQTTLSLNAYGPNQQSYPDLSNLTQHILQTQTLVAIPDVLNSPHVPAPSAESVVQSILGLPLLAGVRTLGVLLLGFNTPHRLEPDEVRLARAAAEKIALAIEKASLYQDAQRRAQQLEALYQTVLDVAAQLEMPHLLTTIAQRTAQLLRVDGSAVYLLEPEKKGLRLAAAHNIPDDWVGTRLRPGEGMAGRVAQTGEPLIVEDYRTWIGRADAYDRDLFGSVLEAPVKWGERLIGVLSCFTSANKQHVFGQEDIRLLQSFAQQVAITVENARLFQIEQQRVRELAKALERQKELDRLKSEFIQNVSHELRTPLALIRGYAEMLNRGALGELNPEQKESVDVISRRANSLSELVENLTTILEAENRPLELTPVDLAEISRQVLADFQRLADQRQIKLQSDIPTEATTVMGDVSHLRRVLDNLLSNALKFTPAGGTVSLRLRQKSRGLNLEVSDTGIGIPPEKLPRIFERFYQVDGTVRRRYGGTGIGLAVVKEIVENHGGQVGVTSQPDRGSAFVIWLPTQNGP